MKTQQLPKKKYLLKKTINKLFLILCLILSTINLSAQEVCDVDFSWEADPVNPMLIHFCGGGYFVHGSFSYSCNWDFGDGGTSTDSCVNHTYSQPGTYFVCQSAGMCVGGGLSCHDSICKFVSVGQATVIENISKENGIEVNYNNVSKQLSVKTIQDIQLRLIDSSGRIIKQLDLRIGEESVDLSNLSSGLYFYSASTVSGKNIENGKLMMN